MGLWLTLARLFRLLLGVGAVSFGWNVHRQSHQGKAWDITWLQPVCRSWLQPYGITQAHFYLQKVPQHDKPGGWILGAKDIQWAGGTIRNVRLYWGWRKGPTLLAVKAQGVHMSQWPVLPLSASGVLALPPCEVDIQDVSLPASLSTSLPIHQTPSSLASPHAQSPQAKSTKVTSMATKRATAAKGVAETNMTAKGASGTTESADSVWSMVASPHDRYHVHWSNPSLLITRSSHGSGSSLVPLPWLTATITKPSFQTPSRKHSGATSHAIPYSIRGTFHHAWAEPTATSTSRSAAASASSSTVAQKPNSGTSNAWRGISGTFQGWLQAPHSDKGSPQEHASWSWHGVITGHQVGQLVWPLPSGDANQPSCDLKRWSNGRFHVTTSHHGPIKARWSTQFMGQPVTGSVVIDAANVSHEYPWRIHLCHPKGNLPIGPWLSLWPTHTPAQKTRVWLTTHCHKGPVSSFDMTLEGVLRPWAGLFLPDTPVTLEAQSDTLRTPLSSVSLPPAHAHHPKATPSQNTQASVTPKRPPQQERDSSAGGPDLASPAAPSEFGTMTPPSVIDVTSLKGALSISALSLDAWERLPPLSNLKLKASFHLKGVDIGIASGKLADHALDGNGCIRWDRHPVTLQLDTSLKGPLASLWQVTRSLAPSSGELTLHNAKGSVRTRVKGTIPLEPSAAPVALDVTSHGDGLSAVCHTKPLSWQLRQQSIHAHWHQGKLTIAGHGMVNSAPTQWVWQNNALTFRSQVTLAHVTHLAPFWPSWAWFTPFAKISGLYADHHLRVVADLTDCQCRLPGVQQTKKAGKPWVLTYEHTPLKGHLWSQGPWCHLHAQWSKSGAKWHVNARLKTTTTWAEYQYHSPTVSVHGSSASPRSSSFLWTAMHQQGSHRLFVHSQKALDLRSVWPAQPLNSHPSKASATMAEHTAPLMDKKTGTTAAPPARPTMQRHVRSHVKGHADNKEDTLAGTSADSAPLMMASGQRAKRSSSPPPVPTVSFDLSVTTPLLYWRQSVFRDVMIRWQAQAPSLLPPAHEPWWSWYTGAQGLTRITQRTAQSKQPKDGQIVAAINTNAKGQTDFMAQVTNVGAVCNGLSVSRRILHGDMACVMTQIAPGAGYRGHMSVRNIKIKSSILSKILAFFSPTLFIDAFSSGIKFYHIDSFFSLKADQLLIDKLMARGLNLGVYLKGDITTESPFPCSLQGVAIPAYVWNTFFRRWPLIGRLLGGNKGIISSEFTMTGPLAKPVVKTKPFSFLKIGLLKKIFKRKPTDKPPVKTPLKTASPRKS